jgi:hypothetical protein
VSEPSWITSKIGEVVDAMIPDADPRHRDSFTRTLSNLAGEHFERESRKLRADEMAAYATLGRMVKQTSDALRKLCGWPLPDETHDLDALLETLRQRRKQDDAEIVELRSKRDRAAQVFGEIEVMTARLDDDKTRILDAEEIETVYQLAGDAVAALHSREPS